jgi:hypothetical protein
MQSLSTALIVVVCPGASVGAVVVVTGARVGFNVLLSISATF